MLSFYLTHRVGETNETISPATNPMIGNAFYRYGSHYRSLTLSLGYRSAEKCRRSYNTSRRMADLQTSLASLFTQASRELKGSETSYFIINKQLTHFLKSYNFFKNQQQTNQTKDTPLYNISPNTTNTANAALSEDLLLFCQKQQVRSITSVMLQGTYAPRVQRTRAKPPHLRAEREPNAYAAKQQKAQYKEGKPCVQGTQAEHNIKIMGSIKTHYKDQILGGVTMLDPFKEEGPSILPILRHGPFNKATRATKKRGSFNDATKPTSHVTIGLGNSILFGYKNSNAFLKTNASKSFLGYWLLGVGTILVSLTQCDKPPVGSALFYTPSRFVEHQRDFLNNLNTLCISRNNGVPYLKNATPSFKSAMHTRIAIFNKVSRSCSPEHEVSSILNLNNMGVIQSTSSQSCKPISQITLMSLSPYIKERAPFDTRLISPFLKSGPLYNTTFSLPANQKVKPVYSHAMLTNTLNFLNFHVNTKATDLTMPLVLGNRYDFAPYNMGKALNHSKLLTLKMLKLHTQYNASFQSLITDLNIKKLISVSNSFKDILSNGFIPQGSAGVLRTQGLPAFSGAPRFLTLIGGRSLIISKYYRRVLPRDLLYKGYKKTLLLDNRILNSFWASGEKVGLQTGRLGYLTFKKGQACLLKAKIKLNDYEKKTGSQILEFGLPNMPINSPVVVSTTTAEPHFIVSVKPAHLRAQPQVRKNYMGHWRQVVVGSAVVVPTTTERDLRPTTTAAPSRLYKYNKKIKSKSSYYFNFISNKIKQLAKFVTKSNHVNNNFPFSEKSAISMLFKHKKMFKTGKDLDLQKKRKAKKQRLETRRQKKRIRLYPRPTWIRFRMFSDFLNKRKAPGIVGAPFYKHQMIRLPLRTNVLRICCCWHNNRLTQRTQVRWTPVTPIIRGELKHLGFGEPERSLRTDVRSVSLKLMLRRKIRYGNIDNTKIMNIKNKHSFVNYMKDTKLKANYINFKSQKSENQSDTNFFRDFWVWSYNNTISNSLNTALLSSYSLKMNYKGGSPLNFPRAPLYKGPSLFGDLFSYLSISRGVQASAIQTKKHFTTKLSNLTNWSFNKIKNKYSVSPKNQREMLWGLQKIRNQSKNNKTILISKKLLSSWDHFVTPKNLTILYKKLYTKMRSSIQKAYYLNSFWSKEPSLTGASRSATSKSPETTTTAYNYRGNFRTTTNNNDVKAERKPSVLRTLAEPYNKQGKHEILSKFITKSKLRAGALYQDNLIFMTERLNNTVVESWFNGIKIKECGDKKLGLIPTFEIMQLTPSLNGRDVSYGLILASILFHFCAIVSLISISQIRCFLKFHLILLYKISNLYNFVLAKVGQFSQAPLSFSKNRIKNSTFTKHQLSRPHYKGNPGSSAPAYSIKRETSNCVNNSIASAPNNIIGCETLALSTPYYSDIGVNLFSKKLEQNRKKNKWSFRVPFASYRTSLRTYVRSVSLPLYSRILWDNSKRLTLRLCSDNTRLTLRRTPKGPLASGLLLYIERVARNRYFIIKQQLYKLLITTKNHIFKTTYNLMDVVQMITRGVSAFFEKPAEITTTWIAFGFLVEWSSDYVAIIPETMDIYIWNTFSKTTRIFSISYLLLSFLKIQLSSNIFYSSLMLQSNISGSLLNKKQFSITHNMGPSNLYQIDLIVLHLLQRRIAFLFDFLFKTLSEPDTDLIRRQEKGHLFWDVWGDYLLTAADQYNINIPALSTIKAEQTKLIDSISTSSSNELERETLAPLYGDDRVYSNKEREVQEIAEIKNSKINKKATNLVNGYTVPSSNSKVSKLITSKRQQANALYNGYKMGILPPREHKESKFNAAKSALAERKPYFASQHKRNPNLSFLWQMEQNEMTHINVNRWVVNQFITYQAGNQNNDLFIDYHPPKSFENYKEQFINSNITLQQPVGTIVCQIYSGLFKKQISKNILLINSKNQSNQVGENYLASNSIVAPQNFYNKANAPHVRVEAHNKEHKLTSSQMMGGSNVAFPSLLMQALAGETELKIVTDNAKRYAVVNRGFAIGIKLLRDVFDKIKLTTPCIFLLEDIDAIGERRPMLISDYGNDAEYGQSELFQSQLDEVHEKNQVLYQSFFHAITHYKKPFKSDLNTTKYLTDFYRFLRSQGSNNYSLTVKNNMTIKPKISNESNYGLVKNNSIKTSNRNKLGSNAKAPDHLNKTGPRVCAEFPWGGLTGEQLATKPRVSYSIRAKVSLLAEQSLANISAKLDMITDLLVIIDSVRGSKGFVVFATTEVPQILDPALRRPGRLDETICMPALYHKTGEKFSIYKGSRSANAALATLGRDLRLCLPSMNPLSNRHVFEGSAVVVYKGAQKGNKALQIKQVVRPLNKVNFLPNFNFTNKLKNFITLNFNNPLFKNSNILKHNYGILLLWQQQQLLLSNQTNKPLLDGQSFAQVSLMRRSHIRIRSSNIKYNSKLLESINFSAYNATRHFILNFKNNNCYSGQNSLDNSPSLFLTKQQSDINYLTLFGNYSQLTKQLMLTFSNYNTTSKKRNSFIKGGLDFKVATTIMLALIQKRYLYHKNLIVPKLLNFLDGHVLDEPPSPPFSNVLIPAKRFENYQRVFRDSIFNYNNRKSINFAEKMQYYNDLVAYSLSNKVTAVQHKLAKTNGDLQTTSNINWYFENRILKRHSQYLINQWWNGQLSEHNAESVFLSDIDWRSSFMKVRNSNSNNLRASINLNKKLNQNITDVFLDFPDAEQLYNPRRRRWFLTTGSWEFWFNFDKDSSQQLLNHFVFESLIKTYKYFYKNGELLDYVTTKVIKEGPELNTTKHTNHSEYMNAAIQATYKGAQAIGL